MRIKIKQSIAQMEDGDMKVQSVSQSVSGSVDWAVAENESLIMVSD